MARKFLDSSKTFVLPCLKGNTLSPHLVVRLVDATEIDRLSRSRPTRSFLHNTHLPALPTLQHLSQGSRPPQKVSTTSTPASKTCSLLSFPAEIKIHVAKNLGYHDLKRLGGTCKEFKELIELSTFDSTLFRGPPANNLAKGSNVVMHPLLQAIKTFVIQKSNQAVIMSKKRRFVALKLATSSENACELPAKELKISSYLLEMCAGRHGIIKASNGKGVTVKEVIQEVAAMWNRLCSLDLECPCSYGEECEIHNSDGEGEMPDPGTNYQWVADRDLFEHMSWTGWDKPKVEADNIVFLAPRAS